MRRTRVTTKRKCVGSGKTLNRYRKQVGMKTRNTKRRSFKKSRANIKRNRVGISCQLKRGGDDGTGDRPGKNN